MSKAIENAVAAILQKAGVTMEVHHVGLSENALGGTHAMDEWRCNFRSEKLLGSFEFFTGLGHRAEATTLQKRDAEFGFQGLTAKDKQGITSYGKRYLAAVEALRKPVAPNAASVLHSLILDSSAVGQSFENWCSDLGYDTDSRKAYSTYEACQRNADKLARVFSREVIAELGEALQDY